MSVFTVLHPAADGSREDKTPWEKLLPMMRLTEMYYIAAEANLENNAPEAYRLLNEVRYPEIWIPCRKP